MRYTQATASVALSVALASCATGGTNGGLGLGASAQAQKEKKQAEIPHCDHSLGTVAVVDPQNEWWKQFGLSDPEAMIKVIVTKSGCFRPVDRGAGFRALQEERALAGDGQLRQGSNQGKGQIRTADYVIVPDLVSKNNDASGSAVTAILGGIIGAATHSRQLGALVGDISIESKTADVVLTVTDARSSEQKAMEEGHGEHTDVGFEAGAALAGPGGLGAVGASSYQNTQIGQVVVLAYIDAYNKLVNDLSTLPTNASAANALNAYVLTENGHLFKGPSVKSGAVRTLSAGTLVYPTGTKRGGWWEVKDELGDTGYVAYQVIKIAH